MLFNQNWNEVARDADRSVSLAVTRSMVARELLPVTSVKRPGSNALLVRWRVVCFRNDMMMCSMSRVSVDRKSSRSENQNRRKRWSPGKGYLFHATTAEMDPFDATWEEAKKDPVGNARRWGSNANLWVFYLLMKACQWVWVAASQSKRKE
jgi:hypothetical protein